MSEAESNAIIWFIEQWKMRNNGVIPRNSDIYIFLNEYRRCRKANV